MLPNLSTSLLNVIMSYTNATSLLNFSLMSKYFYYLTNDKRLFDNISSYFKHRINILLYKKFNLKSTTIKDEKKDFRLLNYLDLCPNKCYDKNLYISKFIDASVLHNIGKFNTLTPNKKNIFFTPGAKTTFNNAFEFCVIDMVFCNPSLIEISNKTFRNCITLIKIVLPNGILRINDYVFSNCIKLEDINFPRSLVYIGEYCFNNCRSLPVTINLPRNIQFNDNSFQGSSVRNLNFF